MTNPPHFLALAAAALALVYGTLATGQSQRELKAERPTQIQSVRLNVQNDGDNAYFLFSENVLLTATNMRVQCDQLEVFAVRQAEEEADIGRYGSIREIIASGNVRIEQQERTATCERAIVQPNQERIVLTGSPVVEQAGGRLVTSDPQDEIILDRGNGKITVISKGPNRLRLIGPAVGDLGFEQDSPVPTPDTVIRSESASNDEGEASPSETEMEIEIEPDSREGDAPPEEPDADPEPPIGAPLEDASAAPDAETAPASEENLRSRNSRNRSR